MSDSAFIQSAIKSHSNAESLIVLFVSQSYLTLGVAVGGIHEFEDSTTSAGYAKPWRNVQSMVRYFPEMVKYFIALT